ncbi:hypothetical protein FQR65_LT15404 [Abscondita terminalis]|nr:hypothetical protein FQR65_LT15404 [Abscondita terminalis]
MTVNCLKCVYGKHVLKQRYVLCFMAFLGIVNDYTLRGVLNIAITEMVIQRQPDVNKTREGECPDISSPVNVSESGYDWSQSNVASVLASFFPGYVITHIPGGFLADAYGGKHVLGFGVLISAVLSVLSPMSIEYGGYKALCGLRFVMGLVQGALFPSVTTLLAKWVPKKERSRLAGLVMTGPQVGSIFCNLFSGYLISMAGNWTIVFYFWAVLAVVWYILFLVLCFSTPAQHPNITTEEKDELFQELGASVRYRVPWMRLIFCKPTFALMAGQAGHGILFFFIVVNLPKYFKDVLKFNIKENGLLTALPYVALWISGAISGVFADWIINHEKMSVTNVRKLYTSIASIFPSGFVVGAGYCGCNRYAAATMFILAMFFKGPFYPGLRVNPLDITKNFAGVLSAFVNAAGSLAYYPIPYMISAIAKDVKIFPRIVYLLTIF